MPTLCLSQLPTPALTRNKINCGNADQRIICDPTPANEALGGKINLSYEQKKKKKKKNSQKFKNA